MTFTLTFSESSAELFRARANLADVKDQFDIIKRENKNLASEIKDLLEQIGEGGRRLHEMDRDKRRCI